MTSKKSYADPSLRPNKRWISAHDSTGKSIYAESPEQIYHKSTIGGMARSFALESVPAIMKNDIDIKNYQGTDSKASFTKSDIVIPGGGIHLLVMDLKPEAESPLHRTQSIDFSICVMGEIVCEQDSGEKVTLLPGVCTLLLESVFGMLKLMIKCRTMLFREGRCISGITPQRRNRQGLFVSRSQQRRLRFLGWAC